MSRGRETDFFIGLNVKSNPISLPRWGFFMNNGWIKSFRKAQDHPIWSDQNAWRVFQWIIWNVDYNTGKGTFGRKQIATGTGLKETTVYKVTGRLREKYQAIGMKSNNQYTEFSVLHWARYQQDKPEVTGIVNEKEQVAVAESNTIKEVRTKEVKNNVGDVHASQKYLLNIPSNDLTEFTVTFICTDRQVISKAQGLYDYCRGHGKTYKDYKAMLRNALRTDFGNRVATPQFNPDLPAKMDEVGLEKLRKMKNEILGNKFTN